MADFKEFSWDDEIVNEDAFTLLDAGTYEFKITKYERARHEGSDKIPPCNKAVVSFKIGDTTLTENYLLCSTLEWKLSQLFLSVGLKKHGEPLRMKWDDLPGKRGVCKVIVHKYTDKNGVQREVNRIDKLYAYDEQPRNVVNTSGGSTQPTQAAQATQTAQSWSGFGSWKK